MRETQLAKTSPLRKNVSPTALRAAVRGARCCSSVQRNVSIESFRCYRPERVRSKLEPPPWSTSRLPPACRSPPRRWPSPATSRSPRSTRDRVLAAAGALGYAGPNPLARNLRRVAAASWASPSGRLSTAFRDPAALPMLDAVSEVLDAAGLGLLLMGTGRRRARRDSPSTRSSTTSAGARPGPAYDDLVARGVPLVVVEGPAWPGATYVDVEHRRGAAVRRPAPARPRPPPGRDPHPRAVPPPARARGRAARRLPGRRGDRGVRQRPAAAQRASARGCLAGGARRTAVVCQSDVQAAAVVLEARRRGLDVPGDLSVAGFDGVATPWLDLELTTVVQPLRREGATTAAGRPARPHRRRGRRPDVVLPVRLRVGGSTGPPGAPDRRRLRQPVGGSSRCRAGRPRARTGSR